MEQLIKQTIMKNILKLIVVGIAAILTTASCEKEATDPADVIVNQGTVDALINGRVFVPGAREIVPHNTHYNIECRGTSGCKININGVLYYESGVYFNEFVRKHKF